MLPDLSELLREEKKLLAVFLSGGLTVVTTFRRSGHEASRTLTGLDQSFVAQYGERVADSHHGDAVLVGELPGNGELLPHGIPAGGYLPTDVLGDPQVRPSSVSIAHNHTVAVLGT